MAYGEFPKQIKFYLWAISYGVFWKRARKKFFKLHLCNNFSFFKNFEAFESLDFKNFKLSKYYKYLLKQLLYVLLKDNKIKQSIVASFEENFLKLSSFLLLHSCYVIENMDQNFPELLLKMFQALNKIMEIETINLYINAGIFECYFRKSKQNFSRKVQQNLL